MGIKKVKIMETLPVEEGKTYDTKNLQGPFLVKRIVLDKHGIQMTAWGDYLKDSMTNCPIGVDRLMLDKIETEEHDVCDNCSFPLTDKHVVKLNNF